MNSQYGFRNGLSTEDAVTALTSLIVKHVDGGKKCLTVFLDLQKAFDTVSVPTLVDRLEQYGLRGAPLALVTSYLHNRKQQVKLGSYISDLANIPYGVPQGSVLGPTLFLLYINELCNLKLHNANIFSYADDTAIVFSGDTWTEVQSTAEIGLRTIAEWLNANLLTLNVSKTNYICFTIDKRTQPKNDFLIKLHNCCNACNHQNPSCSCSCQTIKKVDSTRYLGVILDQRLSWHLHLESIMTKIRKLMGIFKKLRHVANRELLNRIYVSLAQSILTYCIPVWGGACKTKFLEIERTQRALLKVMYSLPYKFPTVQLYTLAELLTVRKLYVLNSILRLHKSINFDPKINNRRRKDRAIPIKLVKTAFAARQYDKQANYLYNQINKKLNILPINYFKCKKTVTAWLKSLDYINTEKLLTNV